MIEAYLVECKDDENRASIDVIRHFHSALIAARTRVPGLNGFIVTRAGYTKEAKAEAAALGIQTITFGELDRKLLNLDVYADSLVRAYAADELSSEYVPLDAHETDSLSFLTTSITHRHRRRYPPLLTQASPSTTMQEKLAKQLLYARTLALMSAQRADMSVRQVVDLHSQASQQPELLEWLNTHEFEEDDIIFTDPPYEHRRVKANNAVTDWLRRATTPGMLILGDYGTGKTSFVRHFAALQASQYLENLLQSIPKNLVSHNSVAFCIDLISEDLRAGGELLISLPTVAGGVLSILRMLDRLPSLIRDRLVKFIRHRQPYDDVFATALIEESEHELILGGKNAPTSRPSNTTIAKKRKKRKKHRAQKPQACVFCGQGASKENLLLFRAEYICERCTEAAEVALLTKTIPTLSHCTFCNRTNGSLRNSANSSRICTDCVRTCADMAMSRRARMREPVATPTAQRTT